MNGPSIGMVPQRSLSETSLQDTNSIRFLRLTTSNQIQNHREKQKCELRLCSYKTFRLEREASSLGMDPVSLLLFSRLCIKQSYRYIYIRISRSRNSLHVSSILWIATKMKMAMELTRNEAISTWKMTLGYVLQICSHTSPC